jgi:hypothetical protein
MMATRLPVSGAQAMGEASPAVHFVVGDETFELVDGHRLVLQTAAAIVLARMRAHPSAGKQQRVAFADGVDGAFVVTFLDQADVAGNIDLRRTGLLAGRQGVIFLIEDQQAL